MLRATLAATAIALTGCATGTAQTPPPAAAAMECKEEKPLGSQVPTVRCRERQNAERHRDAVQLELLRPRPFNLRGG